MGSMKTKQAFDKACELKVSIYVNLVLVKHTRTIPLQTAGTPV